MNDNAYTFCEACGQSTLSPHMLYLFGFLAWLLLGAFAMWLLSRRKWIGEVTAWLLILYPTARFLIEEFRDIH